MRLVAEIRSTVLLFTYKYGYIMIINICKINRILKALSCSAPVTVGGVDLYPCVCGEAIHANSSVTRRRDQLSSVGGVVVVSLVVVFREVKKSSSGWAIK